MLDGVFPTAPRPRPSRGLLTCHESAGGVNWGMREQVGQSTSTRGCAVWS